MKIVAVLLSLISLCQNVLTQPVSLESQAVQQVLAQWPLMTDSGKKIIWVNTTAYQTMPLSYFRNQRLWHIKGILSTNCYSASDSMGNVNIAKQKFKLTSDHPSVKWIRKKQQKRGDALSLYVYKRFYYCDKIYVLIEGAGSPFSMVLTELLAVFDRDGRFVAIESTAGVY